jgi:hypothetical protein
LVTTKNSRRRSPNENVFCVKDSYETEIAQVQKRDQLVVVARHGSGWFNFDGQYTVTKTHYQNRHIKRHGKDTYSHCIEIKPVKKVPPYCDPKRVFELDLKEKYGDYDSYFNPSVTTNHIKEISDEELSTFKDAIDLWDSWQTDFLLDRIFLIPLKFSTEWKVHSKLNSTGIPDEYHFKEFNSLPDHTVLLRFARGNRIKLILYGYENGRLKFYGHAEVESVMAIKGVKNERLLKLKEYKDFYSSQPSPKIQKIIERFFPITDSFLKGLPVNSMHSIHPIQEQCAALFSLLTKDDEKYYVNSIEQLKTNILDSTIGSNDQAILEEISTDEGLNWSRSRNCLQDACYYPF